MVYLCVWAVLSVLSPAVSSGDVSRGDEGILVTRWFSHAGRTAIEPADGKGRSLVVVESAKKWGAPLPFSGPYPFPGGGRVAYVGQTGHGGAVFIKGFGGDPHLVPGTLGASSVVVSPAGDELAYSRVRRKGGAAARAAAGSSVWVLSLHSGRSRRLVRPRAGTSVKPFSFVPGRAAIVMSVESRGSSEVSMAPLDGGRRRILENQATEPAVSPNGRKIAFISYRDHGEVVGPGNEHLLVGDLYVGRLGGRGLHRLTRTPRLEESAPSWSPDGRHLVFLRAIVPEPLPFGFTNSLVEIEADGRCERILWRPGGKSVGTYGPHWIGPTGVADGRRCG